MEPKISHQFIKAFTALFFILSFSAVSGQSIIWEEDFETDGNGTRYTFSHQFFDAKDDYFGRIHGPTEEHDGAGTGNVVDIIGNGNSGAQNGMYTSFHGSYFAAGEDQDDDGGDGFDEKTWSATVDISTSSGLTFKGLFAAGNVNSCGGNTYDETDYIEVYYSVDGGDEVLALAFNPDQECNIPGDTTNEPLHHDPNMDGDGGEGTQLTNAFQEFSFAIPDGNSLNLRIESHADAGNEEIAYDWLRVEAVTTQTFVCPTIGEITVDSVICDDGVFAIDISGLANMTLAENGEADFNIEVVAFPAVTATPYTGGTLVFTFPNPGNGSVNFLDASIDIPGTYEIYARLSPAPTTDSDCRPFASASIIINAAPDVSLAGQTTFCLNDGVQNDLSGGLPSGGIYSGMGVTDDGNGMTYSYNVAEVGAGFNIINYSVTTNGCSASAQTLVEVFEPPVVSFTALADLLETDGVQTGLSGGTPSQGTAAGDDGTYSGPGVTDDGNGQTYSFDPAVAGVGVHVLTYTYKDENGCQSTASDEVGISPGELVISPIDLINDLNADGTGISVGQDVAVMGVVHCIDFFEGTGLEFWIIEPNGDGIGVYSNEDISSYVVTEGDEVIIEGQVGQFQGLLEIYPTSINVISQGNALVTPIMTASLTEELESKMVTLEISDEDIVNTQITNINNDVEVQIQTMSQGTLTIRARNATGITADFLNSVFNLIVDPPLPPFSHLITGIVGQEDTQLPFDDFYNLYPCSEGSFGSVTAVEEPAWANELSIYPNPTNGQLNILAPVNIETLRLIDLQGRILQSQQINSEQHSFDINDLPKGLYQLQLISGNDVVNRSVIRQ